MKRSLFNHLIFNGLLLGSIALSTRVEAYTTRDVESLIALSEDIQEWQVRLELARVLSYQKQYEESIKLYRQILVEQPNLKQAQLELAEVLAYSGHDEEALRLLNSLSTADLDEQSLVARANAYANIKQYDTAEELYQKYLTNHSNDLKVRLKYAEMLSWAKKYRESVAQFEKLISQRPEDIQLRRKYALVLVWMGDTEKAQQELEHSLQEPSHDK